MADSTLDISKTAKDFYAYLRNYISTKVSDPHIAEDLTQEVMYRLARADGEEREIRNVKAWLFQTTRHVIADHYRSENKNPVTKVQPEFPVIPSDDRKPVLSEVDFIIPMIRLLPEKYSCPLLMSDIEEIPQKEIARQMELGLSATKMRIQRGRKKLRDLFTTCCEIEFNTNGDLVNCTIKDHCEPLLELRDKLCDDTCACSWTEN